MGEEFDVIIMDISDPIEAGPGIMLYTKEFYDHVKTLLNASHGVFVTQAGIAESIPLCHHLTGDCGDIKVDTEEKLKSRIDKSTSCYGPIINTLKTVFNQTLPYSTNIPSFGTDWGFVLAYSVGKVNKDEIDFADVPVNLIDDMVTVLLNGELKFYDGTTHRRIFALPKPLRTVLREDDRIMTMSNPVFMY